jgi:uncharacterized protein HemY
MTIADDYRPARDKRVWDLFLNALRDQGVKQTHLRWYAFRAEQYLKALSDKPLELHSAEDVADYLQEIGRAGRLKDWQYRQFKDWQYRQLDEAAIAEKKPPSSGVQQRWFVLPQRL